MAWINLEIDADGDKVKDINNVRVCTDDDGEVALFSTLEDADLWCSVNAEPGLLYNQIEVRG